MREDISEGADSWEHSESGPPVRPGRRFWAVRHSAHPGERFCTLNKDCGAVFFVLVMYSLTELTDMESPVSARHHVHSPGHRERRCTHDVVLRFTAGPLTPQKADGPSLSSLWEASHLSCPRSFLTLCIICACVKTPRQGSDLFQAQQGGHCGES